MIADGAAFGPEIDRVMKLMGDRENAALYLPESFEWLILSAGVLKGRDIESRLDRTFDYVESRDFFCWERYFTALLIEESKDTYFAYSKKVLNQSYLNGNIKTAILNQMEKIKFDWKSCH